MLDPESLLASAAATRTRAHELRRMAARLRGTGLPSMPPHAHDRATRDLGSSADRLARMADRADEMAAELERRGGLAIIAGAGDTFGGVMDILLPALGWLYGGGKPKDGKLEPGSMFGGHDFAKRPSIFKNEGFFMRGKGAQQMRWHKIKEGDREWLDAGVKLWSREFFNEEANVWDSRGEHHNLAALGVSASAGTKAKLGREGLEADLHGSAAAYLFRGDVGFDAKHAEGNAGVFAGGLVEAKAQLRATKDGLRAEAGGKAFVGGEAHASGAIKAAGVKAGGNVSVSYGLGAEAKGEAALGFDKIKLKGKIGLTFGLGASAGVDLEWSPKETYEDVSGFVDDVLPDIPKPKLKPPWDW